MTNDSPRYFFDTFLQQNYSDWLGNPLDIRLAMNAAVSANQLADWCVIYWNKKGDPSKVNNYSATQGDTKKYREFLSSLCADFAIIRDAADCHKHLQLKRESNVSSATQISRVPTLWDNAVWGESLWDEQIVVQFDDILQERSLHAAMKNVMEMWTNLLKGWGI